MARLTSDFFVTALMRLVSRRGDYATIVKKGAFQAGAVFIVLRARTGTITLYTPAPQQVYGDEAGTGRLFIKSTTVNDDATLDNCMTKESRFDPDYWLVELELSDASADLPFDITR